jgi:hypothetical protein
MGHQARTVSCTGSKVAEAASPSCATDAKASLASADCDAPRSKQLREAQLEELASALKVCEKLEHSQSVGRPVCLSASQAGTHTHDRQCVLAAVLLLSHVMDKFARYLRNAYCLHP